MSQMNDKAKQFGVQENFKLVIVGMKFLKKY